MMDPINRARGTVPIRDHDELADLPCPTERIPHRIIEARFFLIPRLAVYTSK